MKILLLGANGQVGWELQRALAPLGSLTACSRAAANLEDLEGLRSLLERVRPDVIVNAAAYTAVDKAESDVATARRVNAEAVALLAEEAARLGAWLVHYSTDYVFDGAGTDPFVEDAATGPLNVYGQTKLEGENAIRESGCRHLIFRTSWVFAARGGNFAKTMLRLARDRDELRVIADQFGAPTSAELIADITAIAVGRIWRDDALAARASGTYHLVAGGEITWHGYAQHVIAMAAQLGLPLRATADRVLPITTAEYPVPAKRPANSRLSTEKLQHTFDIVIPSWEFHVNRMLIELIDQGPL